MRLKGLETLEQAVEEASLPNWDGYGAHPVTELGHYTARRFLDSLPKWLSVPEISVDPDGEISFDWYSEPNNVFSVSVSETGKLSYAGTFGLSKVHGIEYFGDEIPQSILIYLPRLEHLDESETNEVTKAFEQEVAAFEQLRPALLKHYAGKYVAIYQGEVVASGDEKLALLDQVRERFGHVVCHIEKVTPESPRTVRMPSVRVVRP